MASSPPYVMIDGRAIAYLFSFNSIGISLTSRPLVWPSHSLVGYVMLGM